MSAARRRRGRGAKSARAGAAPRSATGGPIPRVWGEVAIVLACVALALWVQRRALGGFFSLDDLVIMEEARGLRAAPPGLWRLLSRHVFFGTAVPLFGSHPLPYHLVSVLLHAANIALLYAWVRRRSGSILAATIAAGLFGASRLHIMTLGSVATVGEPMALAFTLGAFLLADRDLRARLGAVALFAAALLSKESVVLLPAVLLLPRREGPGFRARLVQAAPLLGLGGLFAIALLVTGATRGQLGGEAYERAYGTNLFMNLMTYTRWVSNPLDAFPGHVSAIVSGSWPIGIAATALMVALAWVAGGAAFAPELGVVWWLVALLPVLPLVHHTYLYYLYIPFAGVTMALGAAAGWLEERLAGAPRGDDAPGAARAPAAAERHARMLPIVRGVAIALVIAHAMHADRLLAVRYTTHMPGTPLPLDPDLRKADVAREAYLGVSKHLAGRRAGVAFLVPRSMADVFSTTTGERVGNVAANQGTYTMLAGSLDDGLGLRALIPAVDSVVFLSEWRPGYAEFEMFSQGVDGTVYSQGRGPEGFAAAGQAMLGSGAIEPGRALLAGALTEFPDNAPLRYQYARSFYLTGDSLAMRRELQEMLRRAPDHPLSARVRGSFPGR